MPSSQDKDLLAMQAMLAADPTRALGVTKSPSQQELRSAFLQLTKRFHPIKFARCEQATQRLANEVFLQLREAHDTLAKAATKANPLASAPGVQTGQFAKGSAAVAQVSGTSAGQNATTKPQLQTASGTTGPAVARTMTPPAGSVSKPVVARTMTPPEGSVSKPVVARTMTPPEGSVSKPVVARTATPPVGQQVVTRSEPSNAVEPKPASKPASNAAAVPRPAQPPFDEKQLFTDGKQLLADSKWQQARDVFVSLSSRIPDQPAYKAMLAYARGKIAQQVDNLELAKTEFELALRYAPTFTAASTALAELMTSGSSGLWSKLRGK